MTVDDLFNKANKIFAEKNYLKGLEVYVEIFLKFPKNVRLYNEIKKKDIRGQLMKHIQNLKLKNFLI